MDIYCIFSKYSIDVQSNRRINMKKLILILLLLWVGISFSQKVYIVPVINSCWFYNQASLEKFTTYDFFYVYPSMDIKKPIVVNKEPVSVISDRDCVKSTYESQIGVREATGHNDGRDVEKYLASADLSKGNPWCASFVNWTFQQCIDVKVESPGWVPSWFPQNKLIFVRGKLNKRSPQSGDLIGIYFQDKGRLAHIGLYDSESKDFIITVEGNTNDAGSREGDGVYKKRRIKSQINSISNWIDH